MFFKMRDCGHCGMGPAKVPRILSKIFLNRIESREFFLFFFLKIESREFFQNYFERIESRETPADLVKIIFYKIGSRESPAKVPRIFSKLFLENRVPRKSRGFCQNYF